MSDTTDLYACSKCFGRHPFEELSKGFQMCKACKIAYPVVKCTYCRSEFQQANKNSTTTICKKCEQNVKQFGKPRICEYCNIIAAFIGNKCQRCTNSEKRYGPPVTCEQCKQKCAFDRTIEGKNIEERLLCWLCTLSYKRAVAKSKQNSVDKKSHLKITAKSKERIHGHKRTSHHRRDVTRVDKEKAGNSTSSHRDRFIKPSKYSGVEPNSDEYIIMVTIWKERYATLEKVVQSKEAELLSKDRLITELKADHFTKEEELRKTCNEKVNEATKGRDDLKMRVKELQLEVAKLSKLVQKNKKGVLNKIRNGKLNNRSDNTFNSVDNNNCSSPRSDSNGLAA